MSFSDPIDSNYDIYQQFIEHLKNLEKQLPVVSSKKIKKGNLEINKLKTLSNLQSCGPEVEKHPILPLHDGGLKNGPVVLCTPKNHVLAHYYRYPAYRQKGDLVAFIMRQNQKISSRARALLGVEIHKKNKTGFYNSTWQAEQGKKGGTKTGRKNGVLTRQGEIMRETLKRITYWEYLYPISNQNSQKKAKKTPALLIKTGFNLTSPSEARVPKKSIALQINPQETFTDLVNLLRPISPKEIKDVSSFAKVARGQRLSYYGWQLIAIEIDWDLVN